MMQEIMFRIMSRHRSSLERQVKESVTIKGAMVFQEECLKSRSEWAGSKIPGLCVLVPKGTVNRNREEGP